MSLHKGTGTQVCFGQDRRHQVVSMMTFYEEMKLLLDMTLTVSPSMIMIMII